MIPHFAKYFGLAFFGLASGVVISGAVFAFVSALRVIPRMAQKTGTTRLIPFYETCVALGGTFGAVSGFVRFYMPLGKAVLAAVSLGVGVFYGCLAVSIAEILNVLPVLSRRAKLSKCVFWFVLAIALGKMCGAVLYFFIPGYYH